MKKIKNFIELKYIDLVYETDLDILFIVEFIPNDRPWVNVKVYKNILDKDNVSFDIHVLKTYKGQINNTGTYYSSYPSLKEALKMAGQLAVKMNKLEKNKRLFKWLDEFFGLIESIEADHSNDFSSVFLTRYQD